MNISAIEHRCASQFCYVIDFKAKGKIIYSKDYDGNCLLLKGIIIYKECKK